MYQDRGETDRKRLFQPKESRVNIYSKAEVEKRMKQALETRNQALYYKNLTHRFDIIQRKNLSTHQGKRRNLTVTRS